MTRQHTVAVVGDAMVDEEYHGSIERLAQEATIPIFKCNSEVPYCLPGGAANVARQFALWNVHTHLVAILDPEAIVTCENFNLDLLYSVLSRHNRVPRKSRYYAGGLQVFRRDHEDFKLGQVNLRGTLRERLRDLFQLEHLDAMIASDYSKVSFDSELAAWLVDQCRAHQVQLVVDSKHHATWWRGCSVLKLNRLEAQTLVGDLEELRQPEVLADRFCCRVVITRGHEPPLGFDGITFGQPSASSSTPRPVSVVGAGDCFAATLTVALCHGFSLEAAANLAHKAGQVYVTRPHNTPVAPFEVDQGWPGGHGKLVLRDNREHLLKRLRGRRVVFTNGVFRTLHAGHTATLDWARQQGDILAVGLNDDVSAAAIKDGFILPLQERAALLTALQCVDYVVPFSEHTPEALIRQLQPDILVKGHDYTGQGVPGDTLVRDVRFAPDFGFTRHARDLVVAGVQ